MARPVVQLVATGGTIAMTGTPARPALTGGELIAAVPELDQIAELRVEQLSNVPGVNLDPMAMARAVAVASNGLGDGAVITQGTDTIEETAELARLTWPHEQPLVITGAIRTGGSIGSDGPRNLLDAVRVAASGHAVGPVVVFDGLVHPAGEVVKSHSWRSDAFSSETPVAEIREGQVRVRDAQWAVRSHVASPEALGGTSLDAYVPIVAAAAGMDSRVLEQHDAVGLVLIALGAGHLPETMLDGVDQALASGIPVVVCARPAQGGTLERTYGFVGSETDLAERGVILAGPTSPWKARIRLLVAIALGRDPRTLFTDR